MPPFINGILFGLIFIFALGPAFFALIQTSIQQGFKKGVFFALGISFSDMIYVTVTLFGTAAFLESDESKFWMAVFGAVMLTSYAVYSWMKPPTREKPDIENDKSFFKHFFSGLVLNGLNPFMVISWATWISAVNVNFEYNFNQQLQFFAAMLACIFTLDVGKAFLANKLKYLITIRFILIMNRTIAVIAMLFTFRVFYFLYDNYY